MNPESLPTQVLEEVMSFIRGAEISLRNNANLDAENCRLRQENNELKECVKDQATRIVRGKEEVIKLVASAEEDQKQKLQLLEDVAVGISSKRRLLDIQYEMEAMKSKLFTLEKQVTLLSNENERLAFQNRIEHNH